MVAQTQTNLFKMETKELINGEVIKLLKNEELKSTLSYIIEQCNGKLILHYDGREDGDISDILIYSECFRKKDLNVLFNFSSNNEVMLSKRHNLMYLRLEIPL